MGKRKCIAGKRQPRKVIVKETQKHNSIGMKKAVRNLRTHISIYVEQRRQEMQQKIKEANKVGAPTSLLKEWKAKVEKTLDDFLVGINQEIDELEHRIPIVTECS